MYIEKPVMVGPGTCIYLQYMSIIDQPIKQPQLWLYMYVHLCIILTDTLLQAINITYRIDHTFALLRNTCARVRNVYLSVTYYMYMYVHVYTCTLHAYPCTVCVHKTHSLNNYTGVLCC